MKTLLPLVLTAFAVAALAQQPAAPPATAQQPPTPDPFAREIFPSDYTPSPCAPANSCQSFKNISFEAAASTMLLRNMDRDWLHLHSAEMNDAIQPYCVKRATCLATPGNIWWFCDDVWGVELRNMCDRRYPAAKNAHDSEQCHVYVDTYAAGVNSYDLWLDVQKCAVDRGLNKPNRHMIWWMVPPSVPFDYTGPVRVNAIDSETHVPVQAYISLEGQTFYSTDSRTGKPATLYVFKWPGKLNRVPNAQGHTDLVVPMMTITAEGYEPVRVPFPTTAPKMNVTVTPSRLKPGVNHIVVRATDASTGSPVEAQVMADEVTVGMTGQPLDVKVDKKGHHPEIWVTSPFNRYSDMVVVPKQ